MKLFIKLITTFLLSYNLYSAGVDENDKIVNSEPNKGTKCFPKSKINGVKGGGAGGGGGSSINAFGTKAGGAGGGGGAKIFGTKGSGPGNNGATERRLEIGSGLSENLDDADSQIQQTQQYGEDDTIETEYVNEFGFPCTPKLDPANEQGVDTIIGEEEGGGSRTELDIPDCSKLLPQDIEKVEAYTQKIKPCVDKVQLEESRTSTQTKPGVLIPQSVDKSFDDDDNEESSR